MAVLDECTHGLVELSAVLASGTIGRDLALRAALEAAAREADREEVEECLLQAYLFLGFPTVLRAFAIWRELDGSPELAGTGSSEWPTWRQRGVRLCRRIYGRAYGKLRYNVRRLHPDLDRWMIEEGYGKVLCRPGLDPRTRELCIVSQLAVTGYLPQLHSHLRGALNVGADPADVEESLALALSHVPDEAHGAEASRLLARVLDQHRRACSPPHDGKRSGDS
jgi:4-carboxymuconolactone decarboxylase